MIFEEQLYHEALVDVELSHVVDNDGTPEGIIGMCFI